MRPLDASRECLLFCCEQTAILSLRAVQLPKRSPMQPEELLRCLPAGKATSPERVSPILATEQLFIRGYLP